ncbi:MAG: hypothetical protein ACJ71E_06005 [Nitrososphaeraceae archaeon]
MYRQLLIEDINDTLWARLLTHSRSIIIDAVLSKSQDKVRVGEILTLSLGFKIIGDIREAINPKNWERAYDRHDNAFRMSIKVDLKMGRKIILPIKFARKAIMFWTRSPKIANRIWISIIKDDMLFYPVTVEEVRSYLFDVNRIIELNTENLDSGVHKLFADIKVTWGKHTYTEPTVIVGRSNLIEVTCRK